MEDHPTIVIIKRTGADGPRFPLRRKECLFGRNTVCDLRVQLPGVALEHAKVRRSEENGEFYLENLTDSETKINGELVKEKAELKNMDIFSIAERSFRFEFSRAKRIKPESENPRKSTSQSPKRASKSPKRASLSLKKLSQSPKLVSEDCEKQRQSPKMIGVKTSPLQETNQLSVNDSPRTPRPRHASLRESLGKLRRASVPFQEIEEPLSNSPNNYETKENHQVYVVHAVPKPSPMQKLATLTNTPKSTTKKMSKRVSFGPMLSPEQFDKALPVVTPIKKGATPRRLSAPLYKSCISPARRRYSVAASSFVSRIDEEKEDSEDDDDSEGDDEDDDNSEEDDASEGDGDDEDDDDNDSGEKFSTPTQSPASTVSKVASSASKRKRLATPVRNEIEQGTKLRKRNKRMITPLKSALKQAGFRLKDNKKKLQTPLRNDIEAGVKLRRTRNKLGTPLQKAIEDKPSLRATRKKLETPIRKEIETKPSLRQTKKVMPKDLQEEITKGMVLRETKKVMLGELQEEIKAGRMLRATKMRMKSGLQQEIIEGKELRKTKKKMATPLQEEIVKGVQLRVTRKRMPTMLQNEIKSGQVELAKTKKSLKTPLRKEIESGTRLRKTKRRMPTMLQNEIMSGQVELAKTKKSLKTPLRKEIESGTRLRKTKRRMPTMLQNEIVSGQVELAKTKKSLKTPLKKAIQSGVRLRTTKRRMPTMLQNEIKSGQVQLAKTKKSLKTPLRKEIESGTRLRKTKRRMPTMLQNEIMSGQVELAKTKKSLKTPLKKAIQSGVRLRTTKRRMPTMLQNEIKSGQVQLAKTKKSLKTPLRKEIESGVHLRGTKAKTPSKVVDTAPSKTPKRRHSSVDDEGHGSQTASKKLKTPGRTPKQSGFFPASGKSRARSVSRRKSTKPQASYAEILKRPKLTAKRRLTNKQKSMFEFQAEEQVTNKTKAKSSTKAAATTTTKDLKAKTKTPARRKSQARRRAPDVKKSDDEWKVVVNKRKIKRIKRQRAVKSEKEADVSGLGTLFKTPKVVRAQSKKPETPKNEKRETPKNEKRETPKNEKRETPKNEKRETPKNEKRETPKNEKRETPTNEKRETPKNEKRETPKNEKLETPKNCSSLENHLDDTILYGVAQLMKSPKVRENTEENYEGVAELFEVLELSSPIQATKTPSLRKASEKLTVVSPLVVTTTPSLRSRESKNEVIAPLQPLNTPSLRRIAETIVMVSPLKAKPTPSLKKAAERITVMSPPQESNPPSFKMAPATLVVESPKVGQSTSCEDPEADVIIVDPPVAISQATSGRKSTRTSKRKVTHDSLPAAKRLRPTRAKESASEKKLKTTVEEAKLEIEPRKGATRTRAKPQVDVVIIDEVEITSKKPARRGRPKRTAPQQKDEIAMESGGKTDAPSDAKDQELAPMPLVVVKPRTKRGQRDVVEQAEAAVVNTQRSTRSARRNLVSTTHKEEATPPPVAEQPTAPAPKTSTRKLSTRRKDKTKSSVTASQPIAPAPRTSTRKAAKTTHKEDGEPSVVTSQPVAATPKPSTRGRQSKNVPGIPETPQPLQFTKTKLEPIIEVPTPASCFHSGSVKPAVGLTKAVSRTRGRDSKVTPKNADTSTVQDTNGQKAGSKRTTRSRRELTLVIEEIVEETMPAAKRRKNDQTDKTEAKEVEIVAVTTISNSRTRRGKPKAEPKPKEETPESISGKRTSKKTSTTVAVKEAKVDEGRSSHAHGRRVTRGRKNDQSAPVEKVEEKPKDFERSRQTRKRKVAVVLERELVEEHSDGLLCVSQTSSRSRTVTQRVEREKVETEIVVESNKRPRRARGATSKKDDEEKSKSKSKPVATKPANKETKGKAASQTRGAKKEEKVVLPVARVTRSRRGAK